MSASPSPIPFSPAAISWLCQTYPELQGLSAREILPHLLEPGEVMANLNEAVVVSRVGNVITKGGASLRGLFNPSRFKRVSSVSV